MEPSPRCVIVTPTFNSEAFLDETIASVVLQTAPDVAIDYHIQDGGSTDGTEAIVRAWIARIDGGGLPRLARSVRLTWASERDAGMYDAINRGMATLAPAPTDIVTWINSDDRLAPGAVATVRQVFAEHPKCEFVGGRTALLNEAGSIVSITFPRAYTRAALATGLHDGRDQAFVMQEGTFFSGRLWLAVGGVDASYRLAGDWDLWRRMAGEAAHFSIDTVTAFHRRRAGQLSSDMDRYYAEIDARGKPPPPPRQGDDARSHLVRYDPDAARWTATPMATDSLDPLTSLPPIAIEGGQRRSACSLRYLEGFAAPEGPYPDYRLPAGIRWLRETSAEIAVEAPYDGWFRVVLRVRPTVADLELALFVNGLPLTSVALASPVPDTDQRVAVAAWLGLGRNVLELEARGEADAARRLLLVGCTVVADPEAGREAPDERAPAAADLLRALKATAVVVTAAGNPTRLAETIESVRDVAGEGLFIRVAPGTDLAGVAEALAPYAERAEPGEALADRLRAAGYRTMFAVAEGDRVREGALLAVHRLRLRSGAEAVAGTVNTVADTGAVTAQLLDPAGGPVLSDLASSTAPIRVPLRLAERFGADATGSVEAPPRVAIVDDPTDWHPARPLFALAGALRMLGIDARYMLDGAPLPGELVVAGAGMRSEAAADFRADTAAGVLRLEPSGGGAPLMLPLALDTESFRPRARAPARAALGLPADAFLILAVADQVAAAVRAAPPRAQVVTLGPSSVEQMVALPFAADADTLAHILSACDVAVATPDSWLSLAAPACGVAAVEPDGRTAGSEEPGPGLAPTLRRWSRNRAALRLAAAESHAALAGTATLDALALAITEHAAAMPTLGGWLAARDHLAVGAVAVPTGAPTALEPAIMQHRGFALQPLSGAQAINDAQWGKLLRLTAPEAVLLLRIEDLTGTAIRLHLVGAETSGWSVHVDGEASATVQLTQPVTTARIVAALPPGLHRVTIRAANEAARASFVETGIVAWEVVATRASPPRERERTRLVAAPLAGREVTTLQRDGDWQPLDGFLKPEAPHPAAGLHAPFRWTEGDRAIIRLRVEQAGRRTIDFAITGIAMGQRMRLAIGDHATDWSTPLLAYVGRVSHARWEVDWQVGDIDVAIELADRAANPRDLGVLILGITLS